MVVAAEVEVDVEIEIASEEIGGYLGKKLGKYLGGKEGEKIGEAACECECPPSDEPSPDGDPAGDDEVGGPCTDFFSGTTYYICAGNPVDGYFYTPITIPGRDCLPEYIEAALAFVLSQLGIGTGEGSGGGGESNSGGGGGGGEGGGGGSSAPTHIIPTGGGPVPPQVIKQSNCDPTINNLLAQLALAQTDSNPATLALNPSLDGGEDELDSIPTDGEDVDPSPIFDDEMADLGLIAGDEGNSGLSSSDAAQVQPTLADYDQWEADIASVDALGGSNTDVAGDLALLNNLDGELQAVTTAEDDLFGGDANWLDTTQTATLQQWITDFFADAQTRATAER